jgi:hypothetical protein
VLGIEQQQQSRALDRSGCHDHLANLDVKLGA